jgi:carbon-monoxide dehydrogenase medium subunit
MKAASFQYHDPRTRDDLVGLLAGLDDLKLIAGGQSLMPMMNFRIVSPAHLVDLNRVAGLGGITISGGDIRFGALTRQREVKASDLVARELPILAEAISYVGHLQTRSRGTVGGSCCHLDPAAEIPALAALYDAAFEIGGPQGSRELAYADWHLGMLTSALDEREVLEGIRFTPWRAPSGRHGWGFHEFARRHGDFAIAGAGCLVDLKDEGTIARIAVVVMGVDAVPVRLRAVETALIGSVPDAAAIAALVEAACRIDAMTDPQISDAYRSRLAGVVTKRAVKAAFARAGVTQ